MRIGKMAAVVAAGSVIALASVASAQNYSTDARKIAMGGNGGDSSNIAAGMVPSGSPYTAIVLPFGILQILGDGLDRFDPSNDAFDPVRAVEDISNPLHYTFGRKTSNGGQEFVNDVINGKLNTALTSYKGFKIPTSLKAEGLASPDIGGTIKLFKAKGGAFQGVYVAVGPYLGFNTALTVDQKLADILGQGTPSACAPCNVNSKSEIQLASAFTLGYRAKVPVGGSERDGVYLAFNHRFLHGFNYRDENATVRIDTLTTGALTAPPIGVSPLSVIGLEAKKGTGHATDLGFEVVRGYFSVGFGANGVGNQIEWTNFSQDNLALTQSVSFTGNVLQAGLDPVRTKTPITLTRVVKLPVVKSANASFRAFGWGATAVIADGYNGGSFNGGIERQLGPLWIRGGGRKTRGNWDPTYGFGLGGKVGIDVGFYGTHANLENKRLTAMAVSLRIGH